MRNFRHLTKTEISEIIDRHFQGDTNTALAAEYDVDPSTISYHITKYERACPEDRSIYAVIKVQARKVCVHPSGRCTLCGEMWDELRRVEREQIAELRGHLKDALSRLKVAGVDVKSLPYNGINEPR